MARVTLTERSHYAVAARLTGTTVPDTLTRRRMDRMFVALKIDDLPRDFMLKLNNLAAEWDKTPKEFPLTSDQRDDLISWLEPTPQAPLTGLMSRWLGAVYDELKDARDGSPALSSVPAAE
jgi:hypothetical protein